MQAVPIQEMFRSPKMLSVTPSKTFNNLHDYDIRIYKRYYLSSSTIYIPLHT